jgi:hypothetical protein
MYSATASAAELALIASSSQANETSIIHYLGIGPGSGSGTPAVLADATFADPLGSAGAFD